MSFVSARQRIGARLRRKATAAPRVIEGQLDRMMMGWLLVAGLAGGLRIAFSPAGAPGMHTVTPYLLLTVAPFASMVLALAWFPRDHSQAQPEIRLARVGRWRTVSCEEAMRYKLYGTGGLMVSLLLGMLLNVPLRAVEFLAIMPALAGPVPAWLSTLHMVMTLDVLLLTSLYTIAFVAALRRAPLFPRLLLAVWLLDLAMQLLTAQLVAGTKLPDAVAAPLQALLEGNINKVLISVALWLPYLLLSKRVNATYRHRLPDRRSDS